jgi:hypothetical protein
MEKNEQLKSLLSSTKALLGAMRSSMTAASGAAANVGNFGSYKLFMRKYNEVVKQAVPLLSNTALLDRFGLENIKGSADYTWPQQKELFDLVFSNLALLKSLLEGEIGYAEDETHNLMDFFQANLRRAIFLTPEREAEIQNAVETLIVGRGMAKGMDYDRETGRVKTSGKESIPDFIFPNLKLCLEVKLVKSTEKLKAVVDEMNADIRAYSTRYDRQLYIAYDVGIIRDETEFKSGLENAPGVSVLVIKH